MLIGSPQQTLSTPNANISISGMVFGTLLTIRTSSRTAGAINSLTWNGKEFINASDHGRELQSAVSFSGECYNPTEAGGWADGRADTDTPHPPSSVLNYITQTSNSLTTIISPGYWLRPGEFCNPGQPVINTSITSDHLIRKDVTIGFRGIPNVIDYQVDYYLPISHPSVVYEVLTAYLTNEFSSYWTYNPRTDDLQPSPNNYKGEQDLPLILSTVDQQYAMGVYSPDLPQPFWKQYGKYGYGQWNFSGNETDGTNKWNCVFREGFQDIGHHKYTCYAIVGTLNQVKSSMRQLYLSFNPTRNPADISGPNGTPDNVVDAYDYTPIATDYGKTGAPGFSVADISGENGIPDGTVSMYDYSFFVNNFGK
jgi:hypothetical protein